MDLGEIKETPIWTLYQKHVMFMTRRGIYTDTDRNFRMYNGDQWYGLQVKGVEKIQHNFIKSIVKHKVANVTANLFAVNYSPENIETKEFREPAQRTCELLNKKASKVYDKDFIDLKIKKWARHSSINDEAVAYVYYNEQDDMPINEVIAKNDIMYGDENEEEIQLQPYILLRQRKNVSDLREIARQEGLSELELLNITGDNDTLNASGESAKDEVDDKCWLITKLYRENGTIHFSQSTKLVEIKKDRDTGLTLYPIAHWNWEDQEGNARGIGEVRQLIPNQLETNKTAMRRALTTKNISYPQKVVAEDSIQNVRDVNKVGATIRFNSEKLQDELITLSRELNNAGDSVTGNINPEQASGRAILAVQNAQNAPLTDQLIGLKAFLEDLARIWFEMWKVYAKNGLVIEEENVDPSTGETSVEQVQVPNYILEALSTSVKVDITPKGAFDRYAQELSLENLLTAKQITFEEYVNALPADSVMPKTTLENILEKRKQAQSQIDALDMGAQQMMNQMQQQSANAQEIQSIGNQGEEVINQMMDNQATA